MYIYNMHLRIKILCYFLRPSFQYVLYIATKRTIYKQQTCFYFQTLRRRRMNIKFNTTNVYDVCIYIFDLSLDFTRHSTKYYYILVGRRICILNLVSLYVNDIQKN